MATYDFDLLVIGAGSGGVRAGRIASQLGARVAIVEDRYFGGTCVNVGCVPKKLFVYGSHFEEEFAAAKGFGWQLNGATFDWPTLRDNKTAEIERLNQVYINILDQAGVHIINGHASIVGPHKVRVGDNHYSAERILIATGGWPRQATFPGAEHTITSNEVFYLETFPQSVIVEGGGYIAAEFAGIFNGLGAETHLIYRGPMFLRHFDKDIPEFIAQEMEKKGVQLHFNHSIRSIEKLDNGKLEVSFGDSEKEIVDCVMSAIGRVPKTDGLGIENTQIALNPNGSIQVNDHFQTQEPSIYALGDVVGRKELTPVALAEGMALAKYLYANKPLNMDYNDIATAVFTQPNIATVGLTEDQARQQFEEVDIYRSEFKHMKHTLSGLEEKTLMKLVVDRQTQRVLGCHMVGQDAGEIIQGLAVAMKAGATKQHFDTTIGIHPTAAEEFVTMREPL